MKTVVINNQSYGFGKKKLMNQKSGTIRKFLVKMATLSQLGKNKQELDIFYVILDYIFWENIVTERNRYANQIMNNKNKRVKIDETCFPVDCGEIKIYFALCIIKLVVP